MSDRGFEFDIVVVGGGPAGLAAACAAAASGGKVALVDDTPWLGGQIWRGQQPQPTVLAARQWFELFRRSGATLLDRTSVVAAPAPGVLLAERENGPCRIRWQRLVLATGARELFLPFPGWTLPGVMGPGGLLALAKHGWPVEGKRIVVAGSGLLLLAVADGLRKLGAQVAAVVEQAHWSKVMNFGLGLWRHPEKLAQGLQIKLRLLGVPYDGGAWPVRAEGDQAVRRVTFTDGQRTWSEDCELLACGFGLVPNVELPLAIGCDLQNGFVRVEETQATSVQNVFCAGEPTGIGGADCALVEGQIAGYAAAGAVAKAQSLFPRRAAWHRFRARLAETFALRREVTALASEQTVVCRCEDVTLGQMRQHKGWREAKLQSRCGMGNCQGRVCGAAAKQILGWGMESVRPPVLPTRLESLICQENE
jgi:D-hydroxyproline dehydrogenase subunit alpha